jgi:hypothetical protein
VGFSFGVDQSPVDSRIFLRKSEGAIYIQKDTPRTPCPGTCRVTQKTHPRLLCVIPATVSSMQHGVAHVAQPNVNALNMRIVLRAIPIQYQSNTTTD